METHRLGYVLALSLVTLALPARALGEMTGLDRQEARLEWKLPQKVEGTPGRSAVRACMVFAGYAVLSSNVGMMGVEDVEFRVRTKGMPPEEVCGASFRGRLNRPPAGETFDPIGAIGRYLVAAFPDGHLGLSSFTLFDMESGAKVFEDNYAYRRAVSFAHAATGPEITYWTTLGQFGCVPRRGESACWSRIRVKHGIPASVPQPDCEVALAEEPRALEGDPIRWLKIVIHIRVPGLSRRNAAFLPDQPSCEQ